MKIKEYEIRHYGPLKESGRIRLDNFNLIWGNNETGKTLTIDAILKLLFRTSKNFSIINRVDQKPEGYVIIQDESKEIKLPGKYDLSKIFNLSHSQYWNIFIVHNSDLSIGQEQDLYTQITQKLSNIKTKQIDSLLEEFRNIGRLTKGGKFTDKAEERLKQRMEQAQKLVIKIDKLREEIISRGIDVKEKELIQTERCLQKIEEELRIIEEAGIREKYIKCRNALNELKKMLSKIKSLELLESEHLEKWRDCERNIKNYEEQKKELIGKLRKREDELYVLVEQIVRKEDEFKIVEERKKIIDTEIKIDLKKCYDNYIKTRTKQNWGKLGSTTGIISFIIFMISSIAIIFAHISFFYIPLFLSLLSLCVSLGVLIWNVFKQSTLEHKLEKSKLILATLKMNVNSVQEISTVIQEFYEDYNKMLTDLHKKKLKKEELEREISEIKTVDLSNIKKQINQMQTIVNKMSERLNVKTVEELKQNIQLKNEIYRNIEMNKTILKENLGYKQHNTVKNISYWEEEIQKLAQYENQNVDVKYDKDRIVELKKMKNIMEQKYKKLQEVLNEYKKKLENIERETNNVLRPSQILLCTTSIELELIAQRLKEFIRKNEIKRNDVFILIDMFEDIKKEENKKIEILFGEGSNISKYFSKITEEAYTEVIFDYNTNRIKVKRKDGVILDADKLSGGTYDQLYFTIRLTLAEMLLKGKKGFFIMDDPFIKSDIERLNRQMDILRKISQAGWQIIYLSAKEEIKEVLKKDIQTGNAKFIAISNV